MNAFVADHRKFLRARRHEDQDGIPPGRFLHAELEKFFLRQLQGVFFESPPLKKNADFAGRFRFRRLDGAHDSIVLELAKKSMRPHLKLPARPGAAAAKAAAAAAESTESAAR